MKQAGLNQFENYSKDSLSQLNIHKYRNICPTCGHKAKKTGEGHHENPWRGETFYFETYECHNEQCDEQSYYA